MKYIIAILLGFNASCFGQTIEFPKVPEYKRSDSINVIKTEGICLIHEDGKVKDFPATRVQKDLFVYEYGDCPPVYDPCLKSCGLCQQWILRKSDVKIYFEDGSTLTGNVEYRFIPFEFAKK